MGLFWVLRGSDVSAIDFVAVGIVQDVADSGFELSFCFCDTLRSLASETAYFCFLFIFFNFRN